MNNRPSPHIVFRPLACLTGLILISGVCRAQDSGTIDNSGLIPKIVPDDQVQMEGPAPDWVKTLIMAEMRVETATPEGTFDAAADKVLNHYAEMGVNGLWLDPIYDRSNAQRNGYNNTGPNTIFPDLTGTSDYDAQLDDVKRFVDAAHSKNIRIIFDIIVWGTRSDSPLVAQHPEFYLKRKGTFVSMWGGYGFDWKSDALKSWFKDAAVNLIEKTGADGFRVDLAPDTSGYFFKEVRDALYAEGKKIIIISEIDSTQRDVFDFEENGVSGWTEKHDWAHKAHLKEQEKQFGLHNEYLLNNNIVDVIRGGKGIGDVTMQKDGTGGTFRFYSSNLLDHDDFNPFVKGSLVRFGYGSLFAPFIPIWWIGEEWNNPKHMLMKGGGVMYFNQIDWSQLDPNRAFYEAAKKYVAIRRSYPEIFTSFAPSLRDANIVKVASTKDGQPNNLQAYGRFANGKAILVVPNYKSDGASSFKISPDYAALGLDPAGNYQVTDLVTGSVVPPANNANATDKSFTASIDADHLGLFLLAKP